MSFQERYQWRSLATVHASAAALRDSAAHKPLTRQNSDDDKAEAGDRVLLPSRALSRLMDMFGDNPIPSPLTFELQYKGSKCYVGVQEFSSEDGVITLPKSVITALALDKRREMDAMEKIAVRYVKLPKAKRVVIQPFTGDFLDIPDHKAFMEAGLTHNFTVLYKEQIIVLRHEGQQYPLIIRELEPSTAPACVILNTDCIMETMAPVTDGTAVGEDPTRRAIQFLKPAEPVSGWAPAGRYVYFGFSLPYQVNPDTVDVRVTVKNADHKAAVDASIADAPAPLAVVPASPAAAAGGRPGGPRAVSPAATGGAGASGGHVLGGASASAAGEAMDTTDGPGSARTADDDGDDDSRVGDTDAYISVHPVRKPTIANHIWALNGIGGGSVVLRPETEDLLPGEAPVTQRAPLAAVMPAPAPAPVPVLAPAPVPTAAPASGVGPRAVSPAPTTPAATGTGTAATGTGKSVVELAAEGKLTQAEIAARVAAALGKAGVAPAPAPAVAAGGAGTSSTVAPTPAPAPAPIASPTIGSLMASKAPRTWYIGVTGYKGRANFTITVTVTPRTADSEGTTAAAGGAAAGTPVAGAAGGAGASGVPAGLEVEPCIPIPGPAPLPAARPSTSGASLPATPASPSAGTGTGSGAIGIAGEESHAGQKQCPHCSSWVRETNYALHTAQCGRNNVKCPFSGCGAMLRKAPDTFDVHWHCPECSTVMHRHVGAKHILLHHAKHACKCGVSLSIPAMRKHSRDACPQRQTVCRFCQDTVRAGDSSGMDAWDRLHGLTAHESYCGSRTTNCRICREKVPLKRYDEHFFVHHPHEEVIPPAPETIEASSSSSGPMPAPPRSRSSSGSYSPSHSPYRPSSPMPPIPSGPVMPPTWQRVWACGVCSFFNPIPRGATSPPAGTVCTICSTPLTADVAFKFVDSARDQAEVTADELLAAGFAPDGTALPPGMRPAAAAEASVPAPAPEAAVAPSAWSCPACTFENPASNRKCDMCQTAKPADTPAPAPASSGSAGMRRPSAGRPSAAAWSSPSSASAAPAPSSFAAAVAGASLCRNQVCGNAPAKSGAASSLGVCDRCLGLMTEDGAIGTEEMTETLMSVYGAQLNHGCGNGACRNVHCATGKSNLAAEPSSAAAASFGSSSSAAAPPSRPILARAVSTSDELMACMLEAKLFAASASTAAAASAARLGAKYYICVPDKQRLVPKGSTALAQRIASTSGSGSTAGGGGGSAASAAPSATAPPADGDVDMDGSASSSPAASAPAPAEGAVASAFSAAAAMFGFGAGTAKPSAASGAGGKPAGKKGSDRVAGAFFP